MAPQPSALGIDFGTTATKAVLLAAGRLHLVVDGGQAHLPSAAWVPPRGDLEPLGAAPTHRPDPARTIHQIKRLLGRRFEDPEVRALDAGVGYRLVPGEDGTALVAVAGQHFAPVQIVATILRHARELAERHAGGPIETVVLSMPVVTAPGYADALRRAATLAGLHAVRLVAEPVAALWGARLRAGPGRRVLVCDYGGGTFDAAVLTMERDSVDVLATGGDPFLGGADLDLALADAVAGQTYRETRRDLRRDQVAWSSFVARCEQAKRRLSSEAQTSLRVIDAAETQNGRAVDVTLARAAVEPLWSPFFDRALDSALSALAHAKLAAGLVDDVLLVGGTNNIPAVRAAFARRLGRAPTAIASSDVAVAAGLAIIAGATHRGSTGR